MATVTITDKRSKFTTVQCPVCSQPFRTLAETAAGLKFPEDCPVCRERASAQARPASFDPTAVVDPKRLLGRIESLEGVVRAMSTDLNTVLTALGETPTGRNVVDAGTRTVPTDPE